MINSALRWLLQVIYRKSLFSGHLCSMYCYSCETFKLRNTYLTDRKHRAKVMINSALRWLLQSMHRKGLLWGHFCSIHCYVICSLFFFCFGLASYADDNTTLCIGKTTEKVIAKFRTSSTWIFEWFENTGMKANPDNCYLLLS